MTPSRSSIWHHRAGHARTLLVMALTIAIAAGALVAGRSVRLSQQTHLLAQLGRTDIALTTAASLSARLPAGMAVADPASVQSAVGLLAVDGSAAHPTSGRRIPHVRVYGVDDAFWAFHRVAAVPLAGSDAAVSPALAVALGATDGDALEVSLFAPSEVARESVAGRATPAGAPFPTRIARTLDADRLGTFSIAAVTTPVPAVFVPLARLQRALDLTGRVNAVLVQQAGEAVAKPGTIETMERAWLAAAALPDHGVRIRRVPGDGVMALDGLGGIISPGVTERVMTTLARLQRPGIPALASLATAIRVGDRHVPYSTIAAIDLDGYLRLSVPVGPPAPDTALSADGEPLVRGALEVRVGRGGVRVGRVQVTEAAPGVPAAPRADAPIARPVADDTPASDGPIWLNEWTAADLGAAVGDTVQVDYLTWSDAAGLIPRTAAFALAGVVPMMRIGGDRTLAPDWPGIINAPALADWRVPFPIDAARIRPQDEAYWNQWRTAPKAYVPLETGQRLWGTRAGQVSSIRFALRDADAVAAAVRAEMPRRVAVRTVRAEVMDAAPSRLPTEAAALLANLVPLLAAALLVWLAVTRGLTRRAREAALLSALGFTDRQVRRMARREIVLFLLPASVLGVAGAIAYATLLLMALAQWWPSATSSVPIAVHVDVLGLAAGTIVGLALVVGVAMAGVLATPPRSPRVLFAGQARAARPGGGAMRTTRVALIALGTVAGLAVGATLGPVPPRTIGAGERQSLRVDAAVPLMHDPSTPSGRAALGIGGTAEVWSQVRVVRARWRDGTPPVLGLPTDWHESAAAGDGIAASWPALDRERPDGVSAALVDRRRLGQWGLAVGSRVPVDAAGVTTEVVGIVDRGLLPSALMVSERTYLRMFPTDEGYRVWLLEVPAPHVPAIVEALTAALETAGARVRTADEVRADEGAAGDAAQRAWRALSLAGLLLGVLGAMVLR